MGWAQHQINTHFFQIRKTLKGVIPFDEAIGVVNRRKTAPIDGESSIRPPDVDSFGGINCNAAEDSRYGFYSQFFSASHWIGNPNEAKT